MTGRAKLIGRAILIGGLGALFLTVLVYNLGFFIYASYDFTAEVESIDFYGRSAGFAGGADKVIVRFDDGSVYNVYKLPDGLKEKHTYQMQRQQPYLIGSERLVIIAEVK